MLIYCWYTQSDLIHSEILHAYFIYFNVSLNP